MRHERFIPMEYANEQLMAEWNEFNIALKIWLYPGEFGDKLPDFQRRYPKPDLSEIDNMFTRIYQTLRKDSKPMIKYRVLSLFFELVGGVILWVHQKNF